MDLEYIKNLNWVFEKYQERVRDGKGSPRLAKNLITLIQINEAYIHSRKCTSCGKQLKIDFPE